MGIPYSSLKLNACAAVVRKKHVYDALQLISQTNKKGSDLVRSVVESARHNAVKKGLAEERLFVKEVIIGKKLG